MQFCSLVILLSSICFSVLGAAPKIRIGWPSPQTGEFASIVTPTTYAVNMWADRVNQDGGITLAGIQHTVELVIVDVGGASTSIMTQNIISTVAEMCNQSGIYGKIDLMIGPYSSTLAPVAIKESEKCQLVTVVGGAAATNLLRCVPNAAGVLPTGCSFEGQRRYEHVLSTIGPAFNYLSGFVQLLKIKQAKTVAIFYESAAFTEEVALGATALAKSLKMEIISTNIVPRTTSLAAAADWTTQLIKNYTLSRPDIIVGGTYKEACEGFLMDMATQRYTAGATAFSICMAPSLITDIDGDAVWSLGSSGWDQRLKGDGFDETTQRTAHFKYDYRNASSLHSCQQFQNAYYNLTGEDPTYQAVSHYVAGYVIHELLLLADSTDPAALLSNLLNVYIPSSIYGPLVFDNVGANQGKEFITLQVFPTQITQQKKRQTVVQPTYQLEIVTPLSTAEIDAVYPIPAWDERQFDWSYASLPPEIAIITITSFCIAVSLVLALLLLYWRDRPQIRAASFLYCFAMIVGGIIAYTSMYFWVIVTNTVFCNLIPWFILLGFDIMTGSLLAKNWRLYRIFSSSLDQLQRGQRAIDNKTLAVPVIFLCLLDAILIIIWEAVFKIEAVFVIVDPLRPADNYYRCTSQNQTAWNAFIGTLGGLKAVVILFGIWLAIVCRKQPSEFNESKYIAYALYNQLFCLCILLAIWQAIPYENYQLAYILRSIVFLWGISLTLLSIFAQKVYFTFRGKKDPMKRALKIDTSNMSPYGQTSTGETPSS